MKPDYITTVRLNHNEVAAKINKETGDIKEVSSNKTCNIPDGTKRLNYEHFGMLNLDTSKKLEKYLTNLELSILMKLISRCEFNTNSIKPFSNETSIRLLAEEFNISVNSVPKIFKRLFDLGVYLQLKISENSEVKEYWVLNPHIFWRGRLVEDSLFRTFAETDITKLIS